MQIILKEIWTELLNVDNISQSSDFLRLGGHHRLVLKLLAEIKHKLKVNISVRDLVENSRFDKQLFLLERSAPPAYPPTIEQQTMWTVNKLRSGRSIEYNRAYLFEAPWAINVDRLNHALAMLVEKHAVLRSHFFEENTKLKVKLGSSNSIKFELLSFHDNNKNIPEEKLKQIIFLPFDLEAELAIRFYVFLGRQILIVNHQIIHDGDSFELISKDLLDFYAGITSEIKPLEELSFVKWAQSQAQNSNQQTSINYWQHKLLGYHPTKLELGKAWQPRESQQGQSMSMCLEQSVTEALSLLASECKTPVGTLLLAAFYILLERYCQQTDLTLGIINTERPESQTYYSVGFFRRFFPLRIQLDLEKSFVDFLKNNLEPAMLEGLENSRVHPRLMTNNKSSNDLLSITFAFFNDKLTNNNQHLLNNHVQNDLSVNIFSKNSGLEFRFDYSLELYNNKLIRDFSCNYLALIKYILCNQNILIQNYQINFRKLEPPNPLRERLAPNEKTILDIFHKASHANSCAPLIKFDQEVISADLFWKTVKYKANNLIKIVRENPQYNLEPELCIGISSKRSPETLSDMVAIICAGGAFVPYDHDNHEDRRNYVLNDANVKLCLVNGKIHVRDCDIIIPLEPQRENYHDELFCAKPESLAYIIYTSGSTGRPKGVRVCHRALWHFAQWWESLDIQKLSTCVDFSASLTFDASITTTLIALAYNKFIVVCPESLKKSPHAFLNYLAEEEINLCKTTPSYFKLLLRESENFPTGVLHKIHWLLIGEEMNANDCLKWLKKHPHHVFYNAYGPTEATVFCSIFKVDRHNITQFQKSIPIEKDSRSARFHIVDTKMREVPYGVKGELCIEGPILFEGYQNKIQQTNAAFIRKPEGHIWYRTGDQVMQLCDQSILFLGRKDNQVKIRGVRVELDEIRHALCSFPDIADAIVLTKIINEHPQLVAVIVPVEKDVDKNIFGELARKYLMSRLSASMTPHHFIVLDKLPINKAAKIDMQALREVVDNHNFATGRMLVSSPLELVVLQIWQSSLKENKIGTDSNFFYLGGNSLLAMQVMDRINHYFNISLPPDLIFQKPTIREMCQVVSNLHSSTNAYRFNHAHNGPALFLIHPATGIASLYQLLKGLLKSVDFYGISSDHFGEKFYQSIEEMAQSYVKILKKQRPRGPYILGGYCTGGVIAFEMSKQLIQEGEKILGLILIDSYNPEVLWSKSERDIYYKLQLEIMGIREDSGFAQKLVNELAHNLHLVVQYKPSLFSGDCLFFESKYVDQQILGLHSKLNGWEHFLEVNKTRRIELETSHRGIFREERVVAYLVQEINKFISARYNRHDKRPVENLVD